MLVICPDCHARYRVDPATWPLSGARPGISGEAVFAARKAHCHACGNMWMAVPEDEILELTEPLAEPPLAESPQAESPADTTPKPDPDDQTPPARRRWRLAAVAAVGSIAAGVALLTSGAIDPGRHGLPALDMASLPPINVPDISLPDISLPAIQLPEWHWPQWARLPALSPADVRVPSTPPPPLTLAISATRQTLDDGQRLWNVRGTLANPTAQSHDVPVIELMLIDAHGRRVTAWTTRPETNPGTSQVAAGERLAFETSVVDPPATATRVRARLKPQGLGR